MYFILYVEEFDYIKDIFWRMQKNGFFKESARIFFSSTAIYLCVLNVYI